MSEIQKIESPIDLKPCPFCASDAQMLKETDQPCRIEYINYGTGCSDENCWAYADTDQCYFKTPEDAAESWNKRKK